MFDLTAITTPFGLLDDATREALKAHGGPYEWFQGHGEWGDIHPMWTQTAVYRVKPQPPKPREWWIVLDENRTGTALPWEPNAPQGQVVHVREVTD